MQRCFRAVLKDGQPIIGAATIGMAGTVRPDGRKVYFAGHVKMLAYEFVR